MLNRIAVLLAMAGWMAAAQADDSQPIGDSTRAWLDMQRSGKSAAPAQRLSSAAESRVYARYLESFTHPIPEFYDERESFVADGDSGGR